MWITRSRPTRAFRSVIQALPAITVTKAIPGFDGLIHKDDLAADLEVTIPWWNGVKEQMRLRAAWKVFTPEDPGEPGDDHLVGDYHSVTAEEAADSTTVFKILVPKDELKHGVYLLRVRAQTVPGGGTEFSPPVRVEVDTVAPGGGVLPFLKFDAPVESSKTVGDEDIVDGKLPCYLAHYEGIKRGDVITPWIAGKFLDGEAVEITEDPVEGELIHLGFSEQALLDAGNGPKSLSYGVLDKAGNLGQGVTQEFTLDLRAKPENLLPPLVPRGDDGLIGDADARAPVVVQIPKFDNAREKDQIVVHWGDQTADPVELSREDLENNPFIGIQLPYAMIFAAGNGPIAVIYDVLRNGRKVGESPAHPVVVDLTLVGGPDPLPDPEHDNLHPATVESASGEENTIPAEDYDKNATAIIPWLGQDGTEIYALGDKIAFTWGDQVGTPVNRTVLQADLDAKIDLRLTVPASTIALQGGGTIPVVYRVSRVTSVPPHENTSLAPKRDVQVTNKGDLPGGGTLDAPSFPVLNEFEAIGPKELIDGPNGLYNPVRVATDYTNAKVGDTVELFFVGYDALTGGNEVPEAAYNPQPPYPLTPADLTRTYYEFQVPAQHHYAVCSRGGVEAHVIVRNAAGSVTSPTKRVFCDVKEPSWEDCSGRP